MVERLEYLRQPELNTSMKSSFWDPERGTLSSSLFLPCCPSIQETSDRAVTDNARILTPVHGFPAL